MRHDLAWGKAAPIVGLLGLLALAGPSAAVAASGDVSTCGDYTASGLTSFNLVNNIASAVPGADCLRFPPNSTVRLNGHVVSGLGLEDAGSRGIVMADRSLNGNGFILGPGIVKAFDTCIFAGAHVAVEDLLLNQCATGILVFGTSYKIKEVRIHDCRASNGPNIGMFLIEGGFIESSIVRSCDWGVITGKNTKIWNLVISNHNFTGLVVGGGTAVSRTVISTPRSLSTVGLDYTRCCQAGAAGVVEGCQDGSNSVQDHEPGFNIDVNRCVARDTLPAIESPVITDSHTNCGGARVIFDLANGRIFDDC